MGNEASSWRCAGLLCSRSSASTNGARVIFEPGATSPAWLVSTTSHIGSGTYPAGSLNPTGLNFRPGRLALERMLSIVKELLGWFVSWLRGRPWVKIRVERKRGPEDSQAEEFYFVEVTNHSRDAVVIKQVYFDTSPTRTSVDHPSQALPARLPARDFWTGRTQVSKFTSIPMGPREIARLVLVELSGHEQFRGRLYRGDRGTTGKGMKVAVVALSAAMALSMAVSVLALLRSWQSPSPTIPSPDGVPIGTICAWPGDPPPDGDPWWDHWRVCDGGERDRKAGRTLPFKGNEGLVTILKHYGTNNSLPTPESKIMLPDFSGHFLRGLEGINKDGELGKPQLDTTRMPRQKAFSIPESGAHRHESTKLHQTGAIGTGGIVGFLADYSAAPGALAPYMVESGAHSHRITGGDDETRPQNYPVHWIIRIK